MPTILTPTSSLGGTFLELCKRLRAEAGLSGSGPSTVINQTGHYGNVVRWVQQAYSLILKLYPWTFLWARETVDLVDGQTDYGTFSLANLGRIWANSWVNLTSSGYPRPTYVSWETLDTLALGSTVEGAPIHWTRYPDGDVVVYPTPDQAYSIRLEYQKDGHRLLVDSDSPLIPDTSLHDAIVYRALMLYGLYDANPDAYAHGERQFNQLLSLMVERYTKPVVFAPLSLDQELVPEVPHLV